MPSHGDAFSFLDQAANAGMFGIETQRLVYVGHRSDTSLWWWKTFAPMIGAQRIEVLDIFHPNLRSAEWITSHLIHANVLDLNFGPGPGLIFWDEGPEHVTRDECRTWIKRVQDETDWDILLSCPWGYQSQGPDGSNKSEEHLWGPMPEDFTDLGLEVRTFGQPFPHGHGNLLAWSVKR